MGMRGADSTDTQPAATEHLRATLTRGRILATAGARTFERGEDYASDRRVGPVSVTSDGLAGVVRGGQRYRVSVAVSGGDVVGSCDCPMGEDGAFCKHQVALALAWLDEFMPTDPSRPPPVSMQEARSYLLGLDAPTLAEMLLAEAERDDGVAQRLLLRTATSAVTRGDLDPGVVRRAIDEALRVRGYVPYEEAWDFFQGIDDAIDLIDDVLAADDGPAAVDLTEYALRGVGAAIESVDDSDGGMGELLSRLQALHLAACTAARPDPTVLATRLFAWELHDEWGLFGGAVERYRDVLGETGLLAYRRLAESTWEGVPAVTPETTRVGADGHRAIRRIMEGLARVSGDVDELIGVMSRDLSYASRYLDIAEVCAEAGRADEALGWAERGVAAFPTRTGERLREFLIEAYHQRGRHDDAIAQAWAGFTDMPSQATYRMLRANVMRPGPPFVESWPDWKTRAVDHIHQSVATSRASRALRTGGSSPRWMFGPDGSVLVQIHLSEGDVAAAWTAAQGLDCSRELWLDLAKRREQDHPNDSIGIYQREIEASIATTNDGGYAAAVALLGRVAPLMERLGQDREYRTYVLDLRARHGRKRNLMRRLDQMRATAPTSRDG